MSNTQEQITVEAVTQYGVRANGRNYGLSPRLKDSGIEPSNFSVGETYLVEIYTGPKGGKSINSFAVVNTASFTGQTVIIPLPPPPPSLPQTSLPATPAPGGIAPVAPAGYRKDIVNGGLVKLGPINGDSEKMTKADWAAKDRSIELQAIIKSTLESPLLAQLVVGKNNRDALLTLTEVFEHSLSLYESARTK